MSFRKFKTPSNSSKKSRDPSVGRSRERDDKYRINKLIKVLTTTGLDTLELKYFEELKSLCLQSDELIQYTYSNLSKTLHKDHSQIRLSALQICDQLLRCSKPFRNLFIEDLRELFKLILVGSSDNAWVGSVTPLPPPKCKAELLSRTAFLMIKQWHDLFGDKPKYFRLKMGYNHVCAMYNQEESSPLQELNIFTPPSHNSQIHLPLRLPLSSSQNNDVLLDEVNVFQTQLDGYLDDMTSTMTELESCLTLLMPTPDDFLIEDEDRDHNTDDKNHDSESKIGSKSKDSSSTFKDSSSKCIENSSKERGTLSSEENSAMSKERYSSSKECSSKSEKSFLKSKEKCSSSEERTSKSTEKSALSKERSSRSKESSSKSEESSSKCRDKSSNFREKTSKSTEKSSHSKGNSSKSKERSSSSRENSSKCKEQNTSSSSKECSSKSKEKYSSSKERSSSSKDISLKSKGTSSSSTASSSKSKDKYSHSVERSSIDFKEKSSSSKDSSKSNYSTSKEKSSKSEGNFTSSKESSPKSKDSSKNRFSKSKESSSSKEKSSNSKERPSKSKDESGSSSKSSNSKNIHSKSSNSQEFSFLSSTSDDGSSNKSSPTGNGNNIETSKSLCPKELPSQEKCPSDKCTSKCHDKILLLEKYTNSDQEPRKEPNNVNASKDGEHETKFEYDQEFEQIASDSFDGLMEEIREDNNGNKTIVKNPQNGILEKKPSKPPSLEGKSNNLESDIKYVSLSENVTNTNTSVNINSQLEITESVSNHLCPLEDINMNSDGKDSQEQPMDIDVNEEKRDILTEKGNTEGFTEPGNVEDIRKSSEEKEGTKEIENNLEGMELVLDVENNRESKGKTDESEKQTEIPKEIHEKNDTKNRNEPSKDDTCDKNEKHAFKEQTGFSAQKKNVEKDMEKRHNGEIIIEDVRNFDEEMKSENVENKDEVENEEIGQGEEEEDEAEEEEDVEEGEEEEEEEVEEEE
uniref:UV-stimulated scaffold protein A n=1 Tax=Cacopsylla melanoneura TaxID=428564 RepID=A0A8D9AXK9_9HEMI